MVEGTHSSPTTFWIWLTDDCKPNGYKRGIRLIDWLSCYWIGHNVVRLQHGFHCSRCGQEFGYDEARRLYQSRSDDGHF